MGLVNELSFFRGAAMSLHFRGTATYARERLQSFLKRLNLNLKLLIFFLGLVPTAATFHLWLIILYLCRWPPVLEHP